MPFSTPQELPSDAVKNERRHLIRYINLKLAAMGRPTYDQASREFLGLTEGLLRNLQEKNRLLMGHLCPVDRRVQNWLDGYLRDVELLGDVTLPNDTFVLDKAGLARELSLPVDGNVFKSDIISSYRVKQGVLHNPKSDRRTTKGVFHISRGGLPIPADKRAVPKRVFGNLLYHALRPPKDLMQLPFLANRDQQAEAFVTLYMRPLVCPEIPGFIEEKRTEIRFLAPGNMVCNLDFVESIFGNAGDPTLPENNAALDVEHWTGTTGYIILAPHLITLKKKDLGLPHVDDASERQKKEGMCWSDPDELYNDGGAFKITARDEEGVMITLIADNYFGYCKKEVKTQIGFAANLYGLAEEEHAGGAVAFPRYGLGHSFHVDSRIPSDNHNFDEFVKLHRDRIDVKPEGYAIDRNYKDIIYLPETVDMDVNKQRITWQYDGKKQTLKLLHNYTYILPSGYQIHLEKHPGAPSWRLVGTVGEGTFCHKPCTVSGGGKSEISKSLSDAIIYGPFFVNDLEKDLEEVDKIFNRDYRLRFREMWEGKTRGSRPVLSPDRSLGSVIKLLTPSETEFTEEYNAWLRSIPDYIKAIVFIIKRFYDESWGDNWRQYFTANIINGEPGHELKLEGRPLVASYLRIGLQNEELWRTYKLRQDFIPAAKLQMEDDITASITVPREILPHCGKPAEVFPSVKVAINCENRLFQRPDEAIHRGFDKQTELDMSQDENFFSNYEPMEQSAAVEMVEEAIDFSQFTPPMQKLIRGVAENDTPDSWFVSSANPRIFEGKPSKNPRYLQLRPDLANPRDRYLSEVGTRLFRRIPENEKVIYPVNAVLAGRRNNPADKKMGIRALAVFNPIHYQELPELFMDFICSLTGKSPSTTGAGSEGALTKGPFNAITATSDLNNALVSFIITGYQGFTSAAGYVGPKYRVDHDISLLVPEIWARMSAKECDINNLIEHGCFEKLEDIEVNGEKIHQSRLGYRMTEEFLRLFFGRIFDSPETVFNEEMLKPELQDMDSYVDGIKNITEAHQRVAQGYIQDGSVKSACPPIRALLYIMAEGSYEGKDVHDPEIRKMFTREYLVNSDWYKERLKIKQLREERLWERHIDSLESMLNRPGHQQVCEALNVAKRLDKARRRHGFVTSDDYLKALEGTIGADPLHTED